MLDADTSPHVVSANSFINALNIRYGSADDGYEGIFDSIKSTTQRTATLPAGTNICIGACPDDTDQYAIFFNQNSNGDDGIYLYDINGDTMYRVVQNDDITGGLNFNKYKLINGAFVVNKVLYWNENGNEPRRINLTAFMSATGSSPVATPDYTITFPIDDHEITLIKKPCAYPPSITKKYNSGFGNNFIDKDSFMFAVMYVYFDGEEAVLSEWSRGSRYNMPTENYNYIEVKLDITETVPQSVRLVRLVVKSENTQKGFIIKDWDRNIPDENTLIDNQDLKFDFYANITGPSVDEPTMYRPFHNVPKVAESMEVAKNRILLANIEEGMDTPSESSLTLSLPASITLGFNSLSKFLVEIKHRNGRAGSESYAYIGYFVYLTEVLPVGWYSLDSTEQLNTANGTYPTIVSPAPTTVAFSDITFRGADLTAVVLATAEAGTWRWDGPFLLYTTGACSITGISTTSYSLMAPSSQYKGGVVFMDRYLRRTGVVYKDDLLTIPERNYGFTEAYASIDWELSNAAAVDEIPEDAHYYYPVLTKSLSFRFFIEAYDEATRYATKDANGLFVYTTLTFGTAVVAIAINTAPLLRAGLGYNFSEGDQCVLIKSGGSTYSLPVIGVDGSYILLKPTDIGTLNATGVTTVKFVYRIFTPYKQSEQEPFGAQGELFAITNPGEAGREYSTLQGSFRGDITVLSRNYNATTYLASAMNPNDLHYTRWFTDFGRANFVTKQGLVRKKTGMRFSNVWIPGTGTNGLSAFEALNQHILPSELGQVNKLIRTSMVQGEGEVLLAIGANETASIYLGEVRLMSEAGSRFLVKAEGFIGQDHVLRGSAGTQNHESVVRVNGIVAWVDVNKMAVFRYSGDGIFPISDYGISRPLRLFCIKFRQLSVGDIEDLGSRPFIFGGYNLYHRELYWTIPATEEFPPKGFLDYSTSGPENTRLYGVQHIAIVKGDAADYYQTYKAYFVILSTVPTPGYYVITSTEALGALVLPPPSLPSLGTAPGSASWGGIQYAGATEADLLEFIRNKSVAYTGGDETTTDDYAITDTDTDIDVDVADSAIPYPYDLYDGKAKTLVFKLEENKWVAPLGFEPEMFISVGSKPFAFKSGQPWELDSAGSYNTFFGAAGKSRIMIVARPDDITGVRTYPNITVGSNIVPSFVHIRSEDPNIQSSDIVAADFKEKEGIFYAAIKKDRLSPNVTGTPFEKMIKGDRMRGPWAYIMLEFDTQSLLKLKFIKVGENYVFGHGDKK